MRDNAIVGAIIALAGVVLISASMIVWAVKDHDKQSAAQFKAYMQDRSNWETYRMQHDALLLGRQPS